MIEMLQHRFWLIEQTFAAHMAPKVLTAIANGSYASWIRTIRTTAKVELDSLYSGLSGQWMQDSDYEPLYFLANAKNGRQVAVMPVVGTLTKNGEMCSYGMRDYQNVLARLNSNPNVTGIVLHFNNAPGGTADGTPEFAAAIANIGKATVGFADGMVASAAYYAISQTDHIMVNKMTPTELGSIGSLYVHQNIAKQVDLGLMPDLTIIRAPQSTQKALINPIEPLTEELRATVEADLKEITDMFIADVKAGRGDKISDDAKQAGVFQGVMFSMNDSIQYGLADSKGNLQQAINKAGEMAKENGFSKSNNNNQNQQTESMDLLAFLGLSKEQKAKLSAEDQNKLNELETKFNAIEKENSDLKTEKVAFDDKIKGLELKATQDASTIKTLQDEKVELTKKLEVAPAGAATTVVTEHDSGDKPDEKYLTSVDREKAKRNSKKI